MPRPYCHRLSQVAPPVKSALVGVETPREVTGSMIECLGPRCAAFIQDSDERGVVKGSGLCADTVQAIALVRIATIKEMQYQEDHAPEEMKS